MASVSAMLRGYQYRSREQAEAGSSACRRGTACSVEEAQETSELGLEPASRQGLPAGGELHYFFVG
jgi:hypothetical protein